MEIDGDLEDGEIVENVQNAIQADYLPGKDLIYAQKDQNLDLKDALLDCYVVEFPILYVSV
jgi:hypothetical protein